jgi:ADP-heptose:LPS heptosyltransferase
MHLASASLTPTVGLFSRPNQVTYAPYNNDSTAINTNSSTETSIKIIRDILAKRLLQQK